MSPVAFALVSVSGLLVGEADEGVTRAISALEKTEAAIQSLSVTTEYVKLQKFGLPVDKPVRLEMVTRAIVTSNGPAWCDCVGETVNIGPEGVTTSRGRWQCAFDGNFGRSLTGDREGKFHWGGIDGYMYWHGVDPLEFTTHYFDEPVSVLLKKLGATVTGNLEWEDRRVVRIDMAPKGDGETRKYRFWIDVERGVVVRRAALVRFEKDLTYQEYTRIESRGHKEIVPGVWLPMQIKYESVGPRPDQTPAELGWSYEGQNSEWKVNQPLPPDQFQIVFPKNVIVTDHRKLTGGEN